VHGAAVTDADCLVCHEMSRHQQGSVRLNNADDPTNPARTVVLTGDPRVTAAEALKLEPFCLACHDSNAAGGRAPFADGIIPAAIDAAVWNTASHRVASMTCMGDGETFGCHSTGHGSLKRTMLAPANASQPPISGDPLREEEGMCYSCHDANGPALTNIQSMFARLTHHKVSSLEQVDGSKIECTNCHDPHKAGATSPLIDPDTGGVWTAGGPAFCLACHDGAPPAGVAFSATSSGTGFNKSAFVGTTHATQLGGNTCRHCHEDHGSAYVGMLRGEFVVTDNNSYAASDYAVCWLCHTANSIVNGNNHFADLHQKHVSGAKAPCIICHDTHRPFDTGEPGLINFALAAGQPLRYDFQFISGRNASTAFYLGNNNTQGFCLLQCHGKNHLPQNYARGTSPAEDCSACHAP
jgi:predicted CXXCH cytochrome family protein